MKTSDNFHVRIRREVSPRHGQLIIVKYEQPEGGCAEVHMRPRDAFDLGLLWQREWPAGHDAGVMIVNLARKAMGVAQQ